MATLTEGAYAGNWLKYYLTPGYNFETLTIANNAAATGPVQSGTVLEVADASAGTFQPAGTGADAIGVLVKEITQADIIAGDQEGLVLTLGPATIDSAELIIAAAQLADAVTALAALNIVVPDPGAATWDTQTT
jgi:hypothetical protein